MLMMLILKLATQQPPGQHFETISRPGIDPLLAADIYAVCPGGKNDSPAVLLQREAREGDRRTLGTNAENWLALACTRAVLSLSTTPARSGTEMLAGDSWAEGAIAASLRSVSLRPASARAADLLGLLALDAGDLREMRKVVGELAAAVKAGAKSSALLRACADLGMRTGELALSRSCSELALREGKDSTWHGLLLARLDFRNADSAAGTRAFFAAASGAHDTLSKLAISWQLQWLLSPDEQKAWSALPDGARAKWVENLLANRDVRDGRPANARLAEHFRRLDHVDSAFQLHVPRMLRTSMLTRPSAPLATSSGTRSSIPGVAQAANDQVSMLQNQPFRDYVRWQIDFDDRGVVYMRFGEPLQDRVGKDIEVWYYEIDGKPLLVSFKYEQMSGSSAATRLYTGAIGDIYCGIDFRRCDLGNRPTVNPEMIRQVQAEDREYIGAATTGDDNSARSDKNIEVIARLHRLWDPLSATPIGLLTYALKSGDLVVPTEGADRTAHVEFDFRRWDATREQYKDTSFARRFTTTIANPKHLTGFVIVPAAPTVTSWSLVASQSDQRRGRAWDVTSMPLDSGRVVLSDLVIGQEGQGIVWSNHNAPVSLAPLNAVDRKIQVSLYYQVNSRETERDTKAQVAFYSIKEGFVADTAALQVGYAQALHAGINEVAPVLDISRLEKGQYRLEVRLTDINGALLTRRTVDLSAQ